MAKRWKVTVEECAPVKTAREVAYESTYVPIYTQYLDTLDLEELILWVNRMEGATKK